MFVFFSVKNVFEAHCLAKRLYHVFAISVFHRFRCGIAIFADIFCGITVFFDIFCGIAVLSPSKILRGLKVYADSRMEALTPIAHHCACAYERVLKSGKFPAVSPRRLGAVGIKALNIVESAKMVTKIQTFRDCALLQLELSDSFRNLR